MWAAYSERGNTDVVELLLKSGASVDSKNSYAVESGPSCNFLIPAWRIKCCRAASPSHRASMWSVGLLQHGPHGIYFDDMRGACVIKVIEEQHTPAVDLTGWVEEVDTGKECFIFRCLSELRDEAL
jgi:hypothetical protein